MSLLKEANEYFKNKNYKKAFILYSRAKIEYEFKHLDFFLDLCKKYDPKIVYEIDNRQFKGEGLDPCILRFDVIKNNLFSGWALNKNNLKKQVVIQSDIDTKPYSIIETSMLREDVKKAYGGEGFYGYRGEIHKYITYSENSRFSVQTVDCEMDKASQNASSKPCQQLLVGKHFNNANEKAYNVAREYVHTPKLTKNKGSNNISIIILNLNGEEVLKECIESLLKWNQKVEIIVVDHNSTDNSVEMLKSFNSRNIIVIERDKNYSYSDSNNLGAQKASGNFLIFLNNDIIITSDSITYMINVLEETTFGLLGIKLWDMPKNNQYTWDENIKINQHLGVHFNCIQRTETVDAFELRNSSFIDLEEGILETAAVTAAMMGIKKDDFFALNGFSTEYFYGQEDVDFCLRFQKQFPTKKIGTLLNHGAFHIRGLSRKTLSQKNTSYINKNRKIIQERMGDYLRRKLRVEKLTKPGFWNHKPISIAMIVSEVSLETSKADFFTAKELGDAFEEKDNCTVGYFDVSSDYDVAGYDIVIVFIDGFNPMKLMNIGPNCQLIAWARNWFDRWCTREWIEMYDIIYASSNYAKDFMQKKLKREVKLLRIAASNDCICSGEIKKEYTSDYVFTASYFDSPREITDCLNPLKIPYNFKLFGYNWEKHDKFKKFTSGPIPYTEIPNVYKSTKIVVDDANIATKKWGALNCRIYDSLASGTLCITNNEIGIKEIFEEDFPQYKNEDINTTLVDLLEDTDKRTKIVEKYHKIVLEKHTYKHRCETILIDAVNNMKKDSIAIKIAAPDFSRAVHWGDYYFAIEMRYALESIGYKVRIDCLNDWYNKRHLGDDINIVLRGLSSYKVRDDQLNILWVISHPDLLSESELTSCDHIFIASEKYTKKLKTFLEKDNIEFLPQASAFEVKNLQDDILQEVPRHDILFIGNSRNEYREVVKWCIEKKLPISVYGQGWDKLIPSKYIKGKFIENDLIPYYYKNAKVVLNDHWDDMKKQGFISNRVYDVLSVGGCLLTDNVDGIDKIKDKNLYIYNNKRDFYKKINKLLGLPHGINKEILNNDYTFHNRIKSIDKIIKDLCRGRKIDEN